MLDNDRANVSIVIPAHNEGDNLVDTVSCVLRNSLGDGIGDLDVIVVDDGSTDASVARTVAAHGNGRLRVVASESGESLGIARARNLGAEHATGDVIVFLDAHCYVPQGWLPPLVDALRPDGAGLAGPAFTNIASPEMRACGITWGDASLENVWLPCTPDPTSVPFHIGACQAVDAGAFRRIGGFDTGMTRWGSEDIEICLRMWLFGFTVHAAPRSLVYHLFRNHHPYQVDVVDIIFNRLRMAILHFDERQLEKALARMRFYPGSERSLARAFAGDTIQRRDELHAARTYDTGWLFEQFRIEI
jgi:glycosyltransferase involved in cell wall biosynthesis